MTNDLNKKDDSFTLVKSHRKHRRKHPNNTQITSTIQKLRPTQTDTEIVDPEAVIR